MKIGVANRRLLNGGSALAVLAGLVVAPVAVVLVSTPAGAATTAYTPATPTLATLTSPSTCTTSSTATCAPWNEYQGDSAFPTYSSQAPGTVLPTYTPGGATTSTSNGAGGATVTAPNLAVVPSAGSTTDGVAAYPSGVVGTPGPLDDYCGSGTNTTEAAGTPSRQPAGTTLPLAPSYFPHIVRNADGSLTGYFDYRPKDADEALMAAKSTDNGQTWTYEGEALEQNAGYCPTADVNDDGQGHANLIAVGGQWYLYTLARAAGDTQGVGLVVHPFTPSESNPLGGLPASDPTGIDPDAFVTGSTAISVPTSGASASIPLTTTGTANSTEQLVTGGFVDLTQDPTPVPADQLSCTVTLGSNTITGCTAPKASAAITVNPGDLIEQILGWTTPSSDLGLVVPAGPNGTNGDTGLSSITIDNSAAGGTPGFTDALTGSTFNTNAPNRLYLDGTAIYCAQANANPTTHIENCTTGNAPSYTIGSASQIFTGDPIIPASAYAPTLGDSGTTNGLVAPDGIVGVLANYPGAPTGATTVMYTEKELSYYVAADTTAKATISATSAFSIASAPGPYISQDLPSSGPWTISVGASAPSPSTATAIVSVTCTGLNETTGAFTGCLGPSANSGWTIAASSYVGAPGATTVSPSTLALTGEGSTSVAKLYKNNEDLSVLRVAYTTDGVNFSTAGLANGGVVSDCVTSTGAVEATGCSSPYTGINNASSNANPPGGLNAYATNEGTPGGSNGTDIGSVAGGDATEMRWVGSAGSVITNPDGSYGLFLSGAWADDGDSDAFNQIFYSSSSNGTTWSTPTPVISTDYSFSASYNQDNNVNGDGSQGIGISAYYEGRAYGPSVVQNPNGTLTMVFAGYRFPKSIASAGTSAAPDAIGTGSSQWDVGLNDLTMYRNILTTTLTESTSPAVPTTTTMTTPPTSPAVVGQTESVSATVAPVAPGTGTPTGSVTFSGSGGTLCTATLSESTPDTAACTYSYSAPLSSPDSVTANYSGDTNYAVSASSATPVTVNQDATTTSTPSATNGGSPADPTVVGEPVTLSSTVAVSAPGSGTPTGTVSFSDGGATPLCTGTLGGGSSPTASCTYTPSIASAEDPISATYNGDANDASSSSAALDEVVDAASTTTALTITPTSPVVGQPVTLSATVTANAPGSGSPTGTVTFTGDGGTLCSATLGGSPETASCSPVYTSVTADTITASYPGDGNFASSSASSTVSVAQAMTSTAVAPNDPTPVVGEPVTYTATVTVTPPGSGAPTGTVAFTGNSGPLCTDAPVTSGTATCTHAYASTGSDAVSAAYSGDTNFGSSSSSTSVTIGQDATTTTVSASPSPAVVGQPVTLTATVAIVSPGAGTPTGTVAFTDGAGTCSGSLSRSAPYTASCSTTYSAPVSGDTVTGTYSGDANDAGSSGTTSETVNQDATTTSLSSSPSSPVVGQSVTLTATVAVTSPGSGTPTGTVTFTGNGATACSGALSAASPDTATCTTTYPAATSGTVTASYGGDANDVGSSGTSSVTVGRAATTTAVTSAPSSPVTGQTVTLSATVAVNSPGAGTPIGTVTFTGGGGTLCAASLGATDPDTASCTTTFSGASAETVTGTYGGDANFGGSSGTTSLSVGKGHSATAVSSSANPALTGQPFTLRVTVSAVAPASGTPSGTVTFTLSDPVPTSGPGHLPAPSCGDGGSGADTVALSGGVATCTIPGLLVEQSPLTVTASYSGSSAFTSSVSPKFTETIAKSASLVTVSAKENPTVSSEAASFSAVVTAASPGAGNPTGTVTWSIKGAGGGVVPCEPADTTVNPTTGEATCNVAGGELFVAKGPYTVSVAYSGDANFKASTGTYVQNVSKAGSKVNVTVTPPAASGRPALFTATVTGVPASAGTPTGTVTFAITSVTASSVACNGGDTSTLRDGTAFCTVTSALVSAGSPYSVVATYNGDGNFTSGASSPESVRVPR